MTLHIDSGRRIPWFEFATLIDRAVTLVRDRQVRARQRREAARLTDRDLADIGVSRSELEIELAKPFWRR